MADPVQSGEYFAHITGPGERWDTIAFQYYNDASLSHVIIEANRESDSFPSGFIKPLQQVPSILPSGIELRIPVIDITHIDENLLPPWKRQP